MLQKALILCEEQGLRKPLLDRIAIMITTINDSRLVLRWKDIFEAHMLNDETFLAQQLNIALNSNRESAFMPLFKK